MFWGYAQRMAAVSPKTRLPILIFSFFPGGRRMQKGSKSVRGGGVLSESTLIQGAHLVEI